MRSIPLNDAVSLCIYFYRDVWNLWIRLLPYHQDIGLASVVFSQISVASYAMMEDSSLHDDFLCRSGRADEQVLIFPEIPVPELSVLLPDV